MKEGRGMLDAHITIREKGQLTLPAPLRQAVHFAPGDVIEATVVYGGCILLKPSNGNGCSPPSDDAPEWEKRISKALAEVDAGITQVFHSDEDFLASFD